MTSPGLRCEVRCGEGECSHRQVWDSPDRGRVWALLWQWGALDVWDALLARCEARWARRCARV